MRPRVFFDFAIGTEPAGRVIFELYNDTAPKTAENFRALCTGEKGLSAVSERPLYYKNSIIHRSIRDFMIQGGGAPVYHFIFRRYSWSSDFTKRNGAGGESIYGSAFPDEDLTRPLESEGLLCMANKGPNTNGSQFFVTLRDCPHLNGKHVVFGRVIRGYDEVVKKLAAVPVDDKDRPQHPIVIVNCGELELKRKAETSQEIPSRRRHSSRSRSRSSDHDRSTQKKKRSKRRKRESKEDVKTDDEDRKNEAEKVPRQETEEEYDARLEREEQERLEEAKRRELERIKRKYESTPPASEGGVRFKGRGRMKFIDPELHHRR